MDIHIKRIDKELPLPVHETTLAAGFDFVTRVDTTIAPHSLGYIPSNVIVKTPPGHMLIVAFRSSTPRKKNLLSPHGIGIVDADYCGEEDEIKIMAYNFSSEPVMVKRGEKIAQGIFVPIERASFIETHKMSDLSRGGFGSTDKKSCMTKYCVD